MAKISIICPCYNHEKYIKYFIDSVLNQTVSDFELIIIDDCSTDNTVREIKKYKDKRIKLIEHTYNQGINAGINDGIRQATSEYICLLASDDMFYENYLETILDIFASKKVDVIYVSLDIYDENGKKQNDQRTFENRNGYEVLRDSFIGVNQVPSPGMAFKKSAAEVFTPLPLGLMQYSDWDLHNKFLLTNKVYICDTCLVKYRVSSHSVSARSDTVVVREQAETDMMMNYFLNITNLQKFKIIFKGLYENFGKPIKETIPYFLSRMALTSDIYEKRVWGYKTLINFISQKNNLNLLHSLYGLKFHDIVSLIPLNKMPENNPAPDFNVSVKEIEKYKCKAKKYKRRFVFTLILLIILFLKGIILWVIK